ncbi:OmpA family protein [Reichenbachiella versicolor]|uniref:OmpA family protein n=1 Tax=Reichenbachiella versicolor TaxID=1821036 RepID=UPI000D6E2BCB|nr:OmpA family protein [Reichenbachiella versicolor]
MRRLFTLVIILVIVSVSADAQQGDHKPFKKADKIFYKEKLKEALLEYQKIGKHHTFSDRALYHMEICSLLTDFGSKPIDALLQFKKTSGKKDKFFYYWLGRVYYNRYEFIKAEKAWKAFQKVRVYKSKEIIEETKMFIDRAQTANKFYQKVGSYQIRRLSKSINSKYSEYSPLFFAPSEELIFVSDRPTNENKDDLHVYKSKQDGYKWTSAEKYDNFGHFDKEHPEIEHVPGDEDLFFFKGQYKVHLFYSENVGDNWSKPVEYKEKTGIRKFEGHFYINKAHDLILYATRKRSAPNDLDIFRIDKKSDGTWTKPLLFSENITSTMDEDYPYLTEDGKTLYFSSKGFNSAGGYDLFKSTFDAKSKKWSKPIQLQYPINTIDDDIQFRVDTNETEAYFVSDRYGSVGGFDIYHYNEADIVKLVAKVVDDDKKVPDNILIYIQDMYENPVVKGISLNDKGFFEVALFNNQTYSIQIKQSDNELLSGTFEVPENGDRLEKSFVIKSKRMITEKDQFEQELVDPNFEELDKIASKFRLTNKAVIRNIYFDFERYNLKEGDKEKLRPLLLTLQENPSVNIEIGGHTDNIGDDKMNMMLSKQRANSVKSYLLENGLKEDRIFSKGYGESKPLASNDDEKDGRELNRRIEIVVQN